jgi:uncharacterized membrane protein
VTFAIGILYFLVPFVVLKLAPKVKLIELLSPVVCCYIAGIVLGNLPLGFSLKETVTPVTEGSVLLSIPLLLLSTDFPAWLRLAPKTVVSFLLVIFSVMVVSAASAFAFKGQLPEVDKLASMLVGVYTGGTANLVAIGMGLKVKQESFVLLNTADLLLGAIWLVIAMTFGKDLLAKILPPFTFNKEEQDRLNAEENKWMHLKFSEKSKIGLMLMGLTVLIVGISVGASQLFFKELVAPFIIMLLTGLAIGASFFKRLRDLPGSFEIGEYFLFVFCMAIGSLANISEIIGASGVYILFTAVIMFGSIFLHFFLCIFFKIDRDTALITSMAGIFGPAFIGPFAAVLKNREIVVSGVTTGLIGIALGTYLGFLLYYFIGMAI